MKGQDEIVCALSNSLSSLLYIVVTVQDSEVEDTTIRLCTVVATSRASPLSLLRVPVPIFGGRPHPILFLFAPV